MLNISSFCPLSKHETVEKSRQILQKLPGYATLGLLLTPSPGYSTFRKSIPMLQLSLAAYSVMNAQDAVIGILRADMGLVFGATLFVVGPAFMVLRLSRSSR